MKEEIWKDISGYEGLYQVSNLGNVKSLDKYVNSGGLNNKNRVSLKVGKILKNSLNVRGYLRVSLSKQSKTEQILIHRLVAQAFLENIEGKKNVNHINSIKTDNNVNNLEYVNQRENYLHGKLFNSNKKYPFVCYMEKFNRFEASIRVDKKTVKLGRFKTEQEALKSYVDALKKYGLENKYATTCEIEN